MSPQRPIAARTRADTANAPITLPVSCCGRALAATMSSADRMSITGSAASRFATDARIRSVAALMGRDVRTMTRMSKWGRCALDM
jgi:hypothetical protein